MLSSSASTGALVHYNARMLTIHLVRHGQTAWSLAGKHTGRSDIPLTPQGQRNAQCLGPRLAQLAFSRVLSSPSQRARQTAQLAGFAQASVDDDLAEWDYGNYEGLTTPAIHEHNPAWDLFRDGCPGGESVADITARADHFLASLQDADGDVLAFTSGHISRVIASRWMGLEAWAGRHLALGTAAVSILGHEKTNRALVLWNDRSHLDERA